MGANLPPSTLTAWNRAFAGEARRARATRSWRGVSPIGLPAERAFQPQPSAMQCGGESPPPHDTLPTRVFVCCCSASFLPCPFASYVCDEHVCQSA